MKTFEESMLYDHPFTPDSLVMDVGGFEGQFTHLITQRFDCHVHVYEPVPEFFNGLVRRFADNPKIKLWPVALGDSNRRVAFGIKGSMTGEFCGVPNSTEGVPMRDFIEVVDNLPKTPDLLALNCEGGEFQILEYAIESGLINTLPAIQVQPHATVHDFQARWDRIMGCMARTHVVLFDAPWCWVGFALKK